MKFRKKPRIVDAVQWTGEYNPELQDMLQLSERKHYTDDDGELFIEILDCTIHIPINNWVIKGTQGELYSLRPDIFSELYEPCDEKEVKDAMKIALDSANKAGVSEEELQSMLKVLVTVED